MKFCSFALMALAISGCTVVPVSTSIQACNMLNTAFMEASMAPAWYITTGKVLTKCGEENAEKDGAVKACLAEAWNGYRDAKECETL